jgi:hypothetical protein
MFTKNTLYTTLIASSLALAATVSYAQPPHEPEITSTNQKLGEVWKLKSFTDNHVSHPDNSGIIRFCFIRTGSSGATHSKYNWHVITPPWIQWNGVATKEGDQIFMNGVRRFSWNPTWSYPEYMQWDLASYSLGTGHWRFWFNNNPKFFRHYNIIMERTKEKCKPQQLEQFPSEAAKMSRPELPPEVKADDPESLLLYFGLDSKPTDSKPTAGAIFNEGVIRIPSISIPGKNGNMRTYDVEMSLVSDEDEILFRLEKAIPTD